jgi:hypothetical protein
MNLSKIATNRPRILQYLLLLAATIAVVVGLAHTQGKNAERILIDGAKEPDQIPDWILWNEIFRITVQLNENSHKQGLEVWRDKLQLPDEVIKEIIIHAYDHRDMADDLDIEARDLVADSKRAHPNKIDHPDKREGLRIHLKKNQLNLESRTLEIRDRLRKRIGDDAYLRIQSFARLQIAPGIKIGS